MKCLYYILIFTLISSVNSSGIQSFDSNNKKVMIDSSATDTIEYELLIFDPGYELFLASQPSMNFYSKDYYRSWNIQYVTKWNSRVLSHTRSGLYEMRIDYDPNIDYDLELEYRLYYYFQFFEKANNVKLIPRGK